MAVRVARPSDRQSARPALLVAGGAALCLALVVSSSGPARAASIGLGEATSFAVLAGAGVTNTGPSVIAGNVGTSPTLAVTGFPPAIFVGGSLIYSGAPAAIPKLDLTTAYDAAAITDETTVVPDELGGATLGPGVYAGALGTFLITGDLTLDADGDVDAEWIFQTESSLTAMNNSRVILENGASACNVFWKVGSSATLGTDSEMVGTIMALTSITATTRAEVTGRLLARNGAVTLDTTTITLPGECVEESSFPGEGGVPESPDVLGGPDDGGPDDDGPGGPGDDNSPGDLPPTGGEAALPLTAAVATVAFGAVLVASSRHRHARRRR